MRRHTHFQSGFTLVEMVVVIAITAILGGIMAMLLRWPVQGYVDSARQAGLVDTAELALHRFTSDLRQSLPGSVQRQGACTGSSACYLDLLSVTGGGKYRTVADATATTGPCGIAASSVLFDSPDTCFEVLGPMVQAQAGDQVAISSVAYDVYSPGVRSAYAGTSGTAVTLTAPLSAASGSTAQVFWVVHEQARYVCDPASQKLIRYQWAAGGIVLPTSAVPVVGATSAVLASNVSACSFSVPQGGVAAIQLTIAVSGVSDYVSLYGATRVNTTP